MDVSYKNRTIKELADKYDSSTLISAGLMRRFCNENEDNIDVCKRATQIVYSDKNVISYLEQNAFKSKESVMECLKKLVGTGNSWLCYYIRGYLSQKGIESFLYNDKTTGKLICLLLDNATKNKLNVYFESIGFSDSTKRNSDISDVHFFSYPFMKSLGVSCLTNLEIVDFLYKVAENEHFPKVYHLKVNDNEEFESDKEIVDFFAKEIYNCSPLFCLVGPSGCGKTSIANCLEIKGLIPVESYTTRAPRFKDEKGHTFITQEEFENLRGGMISTTHFSECDYGITPDLLNQSDIFVVDPVGIKELKAKYDERPVVVIAYDCSENTCRKRMLERGDSDKNIDMRIENDRKMFHNFTELADITISAEDDFSQVLKNTLDIIKKINSKSTSF